MERITRYDDGRVVLIHNFGQDLVSALNQGLASATTNWIALTDADNIMRPERLEKQWVLLQANPHLALVVVLNRLPTTYI